MSDVDASSSNDLQPSLIGNFIFDDELYFAQDDACETVDGYLIVQDALVQRMLNEIRLKHTPDELETIDNINFYPIYNLSNHTIRLEGSYWYLKNGKEDQTTFLLSLSSEEQKALMYTMEIYCVLHHYSNCTAMLNAIRTEDGLQLLLPKDRSLYVQDRPGDAPSPEAIAAISEIATKVRQELEEKYGEDLAGNCIEASEMITAHLSCELGVAAKTVEGWCQFDDECYGSDRPWDPHTWAEIPSVNLYIDVTADQFNYGMAIKNEYPSVIVQQNLPHGMRYDEPTWREYGLEEEEDLDLTEPEALQYPPDEQSCEASSKEYTDPQFVVPCKPLKKRGSLNGKIDAAERKHITPCSVSDHPSVHDEPNR